MLINIKCENGTICPLDSQHFAQSAVDNEINIESFIFSLDNFCESSTSTIEEIRAWREDAAEHYFVLMSEAGLIRWNPVDFEGGSDCDSERYNFIPDDSETALGDINKNKTQGEQNHGKS